MMVFIHGKIRSFHGENDDEFTLDCLREKEVLWKMKFACRSAPVGNLPLLNLQT